jgi:hypothetical protein
MKLGLALAASAAVVVFVRNDALACGGCFAPPEQVTVVTDHRMALAISQDQTVLWDQIRYQGDPREFAWVLPVKPGARIELSRDEWFAALEGTTKTTVYAPGGAGSRPICTLGGCAASAADSSGGPGAQAPESVDVLAQQVVGPYESVTLRATDPDALGVWLGAHGFAIPAAIEPVIAQYQQEQFDFIALRLRPGCNVRSMKPVRIVSPGADPTLPLRMVAAGVGATVGITLFVIGEGRWHPQNFPDANIDFGKLVWDTGAAKSNYSLLSQSALAENGGRGWLTEYAGDLGTISSTYYGQCRATLPSGTGGGTNAPPCDRDDAGMQPSDASSDAEPEGGSIIDAAPKPDAGTDACAAWDDLDTALRGLHGSDVWVTRMRAVLPASALTQDLKLEATYFQSRASNIHYAAKAINCPPSRGARAYACASAPGRDAKDDLGSITLVLGAAISLSVVLRRRRR